MNRLALLIGAVCLVVGLSGGYFLASHQLEQAVTPAQEARKPLFYRNPMNPSITSPVPAQDHMGMDYIAVYEEEETGAAAGAVKIDPVIQANIGLRTAVAEKKAMSRTIRAAGRVDYDEESLLRLHPKVEGWIRQLRIDKTGQAVKADDILLTIYSPKLVATQQEYLLALKNHDALKDSPFEDIRVGAENLVKSSRERLVLLDVPEHQIVELERSGNINEGLHIHSPAGGTVLSIGARQGQFVTPATELYRIADLTTVWVYADVYQYELPWVSEGDKVNMSLASLPGQTFVGEVAHIYPYAQAATRTTRIRVVFDNPDGTLRPEMFADLSILASEKPDQIVVPAEAVVRSGDFDQVFVLTDTGHFEPRRVELGVESQGEVAVTSGIAAGERVVVSSQFLVDSESKLREATLKMTAPKHSEQGGHEGMHHD